MTVDEVKDLQKVVSKCNEMERRLNKVEEQFVAIHDLATSVNVLAERMTNFDSRLSSVDSNIADLKSKPQKRWDNFISTVITALATALVGYLLAHFGIM